jgi:hypothetical protein
MTTDDKELALLPCPFCRTEMHNHGHCFSHPRPAKGDCIIRHYSFDRQKIAAWNTRPEAADRIEQLSSALRDLAIVSAKLLVATDEMENLRPQRQAVLDETLKAEACLQSLQVEQLSSGARKRAYWERPFGDAGDAIDYALDHLSPMANTCWFLDDWRLAGADSNFAARWPGYMRWLKVQQEGAKASALQSLQVGGE